MPQSGYEAERSAVLHPMDDGVFLGTESTTGHDAAAVVSLCRLGTADVPSSGVAAEDHLEVRLLDSDDPDANCNLEFILADTSDVIAEMRAEGHRVLVHCVRAEQRTPSVALAYAIRKGATPEEAQVMIANALPDSRRSCRLWDQAAGGRLY